MSFDDVSRLLIALAIVDWVCTVVIVLAASDHRNAALTERAVTSVILSVIASCAAVLGLLQLGFVHFDNDLVTLLLSGALVLVSLPQIIWALLLLTGRFK